MSIPVGICPKCGNKKIGYALRYPRNQMCPKCGVGMKIIEDEKQSTYDGYSPLTADQYYIETGQSLDEEKVPKDEKA